MRRKVLSALLLAAALLSMGVGALAAKKPVIRFPAKVGLMVEGDTATLKPRLKRIAADALVWESSDEAVCLVSGGSIRALRAGKSVITAAGGGAKARCGVVVLPEKVSLSVGEKVSLPRGGVEKYAVKDKKIATISRKGVITGKKAGQTWLRVKYGRQKVLLPLIVTDAGQTPTPTAVPAAQSAAARLDCASTTDQIVLVTYTGGSDATLSLHEKKDGVWTELTSWAAYVGKNGIGKEKEGDKKTPVGTYNLTTPFGIKADPGANMDYVQVTKYHYWCGASSSKYYNQLVDERIADRKHTSSDEYLISYKGVYNYCMFIDYNASGEPHKGSCIFLHCTGKNKYTAGCVAVPEDAMKQIIRWARPGVKIVITK